MKKFLSCLLVAVAVSGIAACSGGNKNAVPSTQANNNSESDEESLSNSESKSDSSGSIAEGGSVISDSSCAGAVNNSKFKGEGTKTYTLGYGFNMFEYTFTYKDNKVLSESEHTIRRYRVENFLHPSKEDAEERLKPEIETLNALEGITATVVFNDDYYVKDISIDYTKTDIDKLAEVQKEKHIHFTSMENNFDMTAIENQFIPPRFTKKSSPKSTAKYSGTEFSGKGTKVYIHPNIPEADFKITFTYEDNKALSESIYTKKLYYDDYFNSKEEAEEILTPLNEKSNSIEGVTSKMTFNDDHYITDYTVDFTKVDFDKLAETNGGYYIYSDESDLNMEDIYQELSFLGYVEKK